MDTLRFDREGPIGIVTIDRPAVRNCIDRETAAGLAESFESFEADDDLAVAVLAGADGCFCAGSVSEWRFRTNHSG